MVAILSTHDPWSSAEGVFSDQVLWRSACKIKAFKNTEFKENSWLQFLNLAVDAQKNGEVIKPDETTTPFWEMFLLLSAPRRLQTSSNKHSSAILRPDCKMKSQYLTGYTNILQIEAAIDTCHFWSAFCLVYLHDLAQKSHFQDCNFGSSVFVCSCWLGDQYFKPANISQPAQHGALLPVYSSYDSRC